MARPDGTSTPREVIGSPSTLPMMLKAALPVLPGVSMLPGIKKTGSTLPDLALTRHDVAIDRAHVAAYSSVCGFSLKDAVPVTYPHLLAFGLHMSIMTDSAFPFPAIGTVHLENSITAHRAISASEKLQVTARAQDLRDHAKGQVFDMFTEVHSAGELVWEETSTFLRQGRPHEDAPGSTKSLEQVSGTDMQWRLGGDLGRRYAAVSGDHNPIHLYGLSAKAFGFPRQIAHGMWSKARCLADLEGRFPDAVTVDVAFKKPILLPGSVAFGARKIEMVAGSSAPRNAHWSFSLSSPKDGAPHLLGRTTAL